MTVALEADAIRRAAGLTKLDHVVVLRVDGRDAFALLDQLSSRPLFVRDGQMSHTLLLRDDATIFADAFLCCDEDGFFVLAEGATEQALIEHIQATRGEWLAASEVVITSLSSTHELWGVNGAYAWEMVAGLLGPTVLGMPYLSLMRLSLTGLDAGVCFRAGKTGEYGYDLLFEKANAAAQLARLRAFGQPLGLRDVSLSTLDLCARENWQFDIRMLSDMQRASLTPLELQLQWRVSYDRDFVGSDALRARRAAGLTQRATSFRSRDQVSAGQPVLLNGQHVGEILVTDHSAIRGEWIGVALLSIAVAHPRITSFTVDTGSAQTPIETMTPPLINNLSLHLDIHRHSIRTRDTDEFPPLVLP